MKPDAKKQCIFSPPEKSREIDYTITSYSPLASIRIQIDLACIKRWLFAVATKKQSTTWENMALYMNKKYYPASYFLNAIQWPWPSLFCLSVHVEWILAIGDFLCLFFLLWYTVRFQYRNINYGHIIIIWKLNSYIVCVSNAWKLAQESEGVKKKKRKSTFCCWSAFVNCHNCRI